MSPEAFSPGEGYATCCLTSQDTCNEILKRGGFTRNRLPPAEFTVTPAPAPESPLLEPNRDAASLVEVGTGMNCLLAFTKLPCLYS